LLRLHLPLNDKA